MRLPLLLLALLHAYVGARLLAAWPAGAVAIGGLALAALFGLLIAALPASRRRPSPGWLGWAGLLGIGFFSSLFVLTLLRDALLLAAAAFGLGHDATASSAAAVPALALLASAVGFLNARRRPAVRHVDVPIDGLAAPLNGFSIVQISDLHVGPTIRRGFVQAVVDAANRLEPDLTVITGDLVDGRVADLSEHTAPLGGLRARHGVMAVTGNHEYYAGARAWIDEFRRLGLTVLMNEHVVLEQAGAQMVVAGVADFSAHHFEPSHRSDPQASLRGAPLGTVMRLLLAHQPRSAAAAAAAGFDLQLSGHTHGGQFWPWRWFVPLQQPFTAGLHRLGRLWVYVSRGTGYWDPPKRLGAPSEITRLRLVAALAS